MTAPHPVMPPAERSRLDAALRALERLGQRLAAAPRRVQMALIAALSLAVLLPGYASLPVMDRDEARFVQASRQMVQSGDPIDIRFQDEARHKKPVGIYWAQAAAALASGQGADAPLWVWRLPSLSGAVAACLLVAVVAMPLVGAPAGLLAALIFAATLVLGAEARIAKTDAALLALILGAQAGLARVYMAGFAGEVGPRPVTRGAVWAVWLSLAGAGLVKGPIGPMIVGLTVLALVLGTRRARWLRPLLNGPAIAVACALVLPWLIAITLRTDGTFWQDSVGDDLLAKAAAGVEGKGAPPGTYLALLWVTFFPATLVLLPALARLWPRRRDPALGFLLAWTLPSWAVFEAVPTKLIHYPLPLYPALAILAATLWLGRATGAADAAPRSGLGWPLTAACALALAIPLAAMALLAAEALRMGADPARLWPLAAGAGGAALAGLLALRAMRRDLRWAAAILAALAGALLHPALIVTLTRLPVIWPTERIMDAAQPLAAARGCERPHLAGWGYDEPSLVWRGGRETRLLDRDAPPPADVLADPCIVIAADLDRVTAPLPPGVTASASLYAFALGAGRAVHLTLLQPPPASDAPQTR